MGQIVSAANHGGSQAGQHRCHIFQNDVEAFTIAVCKGLGYRIR
jgi:hypothetical protein